MAEITIVKPHDEGKSALEVTVNGEKWSITRGETVDVPEYIATEVRRSLAQRDSLSLSDRDEREGEPEGGGGGGGSNVETATIVISVSNGTPTITSGAFPDWCTAENSDYIYGKTIFEGNITIETGLIKIYAKEDLSTSADVLFFYGCEEAQQDSPQFFYVLADGSIVTLNFQPPDDGTITITLIYMPEE